MKKLLIIICAAFLLMGCFSAPASNNEVKQVKENVDTDRFFTVSLGQGFQILVDRETRVQYLMYSPSMYTGYMSTLVDSLGKPILFNGNFPE